MMPTQDPEYCNNRPTVRSSYRLSVTRVDQAKKAQNYAIFIVQYSLIPLVFAG